MAAQVPDTLAETLSNQINYLIRDTPVYLDINNLALRRLANDAKKLLPIDAVNAYLSLGKIYVLSGDVVNSRDCVKKAIRINADIDSYGTGLSCECNFGFMSEAQKFYAIVGDPRNGVLSKALHYGVGCGAISKVNEFIEEAESMGLDIQSVNEVQIAKQAHEIFRASNISDELIGSMLDLAGEVIRERRVIYSGLNASMDIEHRRNPVDSCVYYRLPIDLPGAEVAQMSSLLADKLIEKFDELPDQLFISFTPLVR